MGLFGSKGSSSDSKTDRILTPTQVAEVLADEYDPSSEAVIFVHATSREITPADTWLLPMIQFAFTKEPKLGLVYGTGSGCALIRQTALRQIQAASRGAGSSGGQIRSCADLMKALERAGFSLKQDPRLDLDLLP
jgi:hypothetical protein